MRKSRDAQVKEYLELSKESALNLLDIINDILDLSKIEAGKMTVSNEPFGLRKVLEYTIEPFAIAARRKGLTLDYSFDRSAPDRVLGDAGRLRQVLNNLLGNALKFTTKGGIDIFVEPVDRKSDRTATCRFSIRDTGIGIPAQKLEAIFDSFEQAHASSATMCGGTGLGLAISKRLVEIMGGEIKVQSRENVGSTFTFTIVFDLPETLVEKEETVGVEQYHGRPLHILAAEDNRMNRVFIKAILEASGHTVVLVETGRAAIEKLAGEKFDVVLMDIRMPDMDGDEAARTIRNQPPEGVNPNVPIIAMTAYALRDEIDLYMQSGFNAYLTKPIEVEKLNKILSEL
jgi:CheY-like chemotaxis protein